MPSQRFYSPNNFVIGQTINIEDSEHHHLYHVMRIQVGEEIELVNGQGALATGVIETMEKRRAVLRILTLFVEKPPSIEIILAQAIPRSNRIDFIVEKGTELGMTQLWLYPAQQGERRRLSDSQLERLHGITIAAMKQCGRLHLPQIIQKKQLSDWEIPEYASFFGDISADAKPLLSEWPKEGISKGIVFFVGPESGFTAFEVEQLHRIGAKGVKLHQNILRTDTASLAALSLITHQILVRD